MEMPEEGTVALLLTAPNGDWLTNSDQYTFGPFVDQLPEWMSLTAIKTKSRKLRLTVFIGDAEYSYVGSCPDSTPHPRGGLPVSVRWTPDWIDLTIGEKTFPRKSRAS